MAIVYVGKQESPTVPHLLPERTNRRFVRRDKEAEKNVLPARLRWSGEQKEFTLDDLVALVAEKLQGYPTERLPVPDRVSRQPVFRG